MPIPHWFAVVTLLSLPVAALAQNNPSAPDPADPRAPVKQVRYESAFANYQPALNEEQTPDEVWRGANDEMGRLGGHVGHIREGVDDERSEPAQALPNEHSKGH